MQPVCKSASRYHVLRNVGLKGMGTSKDRWTERLRMELERARSVTTSAMLHLSTVHCYSWHSQGSRFPNTATFKSHRSQTTCTTSPFNPGPLLFRGRSGLMSSRVVHRWRIISQSFIVVRCIALM